MQTESQPVHLLVVDGEGHIIRTNDSVRRKFGLVNGRRCADVVSVTDGDEHRVCRHDCPQALIAQGVDTQDVRGTISGEPFRVRCSTMDDGVVVMLTPMAAKARPGEHLTPREQEVLRLVAHGFTARRIAQRLSLSPSTIRTHVEHIRDKLGCRTRAEAVARALALGLFDEA